MPFSVTENIFLSDRLVEGECPNGDNDKARGDQCDVCGRTLDPTDLGNIRSKEMDLYLNLEKHLIFSKIK